ncbi:MAG: hypothetical protein NTZ34_01055 [Chloroflexi bacterium]|nr:hypothetical protein [Chloroflexota bacterium]
MTKKFLVVYTGDDPRESKDDIQVENGDTLYLVIQAGGRTFTSNKFKLGPEDMTIDPASLDGEPGKPYTFTAIISSPPAKARYAWAVDGALQKTQGRELRYTFAKEGSYTITCELYDDASANEKLIGEATASATIKASSSGGTPAFVRDCKYISFVLNPKANFVHNFYKDDMSKKDADTRTPMKYVVNEINIPITWRSVNFSGKYKGKPTLDWYSRSGSSGVSPNYIEDCTIDGYVTADGKTIKQLKMTIIYTLASEGYAETWQYVFTDIPFTEDVNTMNDRDSAMRNLIHTYEVYSSNSPQTHGKFSATYLGKPESYRSLDGTDKMTDGKGTARNTMWEYYSIPELGAIRFGLKVNTVKMNGL